MIPIKNLNDIPTKAAEKLNLMRDLEKQVFHAVHALFTGAVRYEDIYQSYWYEATQVYENDGNTPAKGTRYNGCSIIPLYRAPTAFIWGDVQSARHGSPISAIHIHTDFAMRNSDGNIYSNVVNQSLYVSPLFDTPTLKTHKIDHSSHCISLSKGMLVEMCMMIADIQKQHEMYKRVESYYLDASIEAAELLTKGDCPETEHYGTVP